MLLPGMLAIGVGKFFPEKSKMLSENTKMLSAVPKNASYRK